MEKYILDLISENNRVIIPNFGAFIVSKEHGPSILFNNFLSFNDGLLVNYVAEQKGIETVAATDEVFNFVDGLKKELDESGEYVIKKLGTFKKDENGILRFNQSDDFAAQFTEGLVKSDEASEEKLEGAETSEETSETKDGVLILDEEKSEDTSIKDEVEEKAVDVEKTKVDDEPAKPIVKEFPKKDNKVIVTPPVSTKAVEEKKKPEPIKKTTYKKTVVKQKEDKRGLIAFIAIAVIVVLCVVGYFVFFNKPEKEPIKIAQKEIVKPKPKKTPVKKDTTLAEKKKVVKPKEEAKLVVPALAKGQFHIIVGGFKNVENANKMVDKLKSEGYTNAQMIVKDKMHLVSIDNNVSYSKMEAKQQEILSKQMGSWLYKVK
ncbi:SPOR domain-containing protein [Labilibacter marinus]|uniref:SPOR domain-containing protein n=1 Tax=Labilibacter marinus TaxID=1477105 RepID=UPI000832D7EC|nr:SPOR domain-containing protein [Labilibacter marinus]